MAKLIKSVEIYTNEYDKEVIYVVEFAKYGAPKRERTFKTKSQALRFAKAYL